MCIYCGTDNYRKIYVNHFGPIPKDDAGRTHEIHHIDGNHSNNELNNLTCVTLTEHYNIHHSQSDWGACLLMAGRMNLTPKEKSELARANANARVESGTHPFLGGEMQRKTQLERVANGTHHLLSGEQQKALHQKRRDADIPCHLGKEFSNKYRQQNSHAQQIRIANGTHNILELNSFTWECPVCSFNGKGKSNYNRHLRLCEAKVSQS